MSARIEPRIFLSIFVLVVLAVLAGATVAGARDVAGTWSLGVESGVMKLTEGKWDYSNVDQFFGVNFERGLSSQWVLQLSYKYGFVRPGVGFQELDSGWSFASGSPYYTTVSHPSFSLFRRFNPEGRINPKAGMGLGLTSWKVLNMRDKDVGLFPSGDPVEGYDVEKNPVPLEGTDFTLTMETGVDAFLRENLALNLGARISFNPGNEKDNSGASSYWGPDHADVNTARIDLFLGMTYWFGSKDRDGDGILDEDDLCPKNAEDFDGFNDLDGCPDPDNDGDRIMDTMDQCPDLPEDFDGFQDEDGCPEADNDGDGIIDGRDQCPEQAEDLDGFEDEDGCPEEDNDEDGVLDEVDQCPNTPARTAVDQNGCPRVEEIQQDLILEGVTFVTASAQLTPESLGILSSVAESLMAWPDVRIEIRGHTDSTGSPEGNRDLSHRRALAVKDSLVHLGVTPTRITAIGYGEDYPLANNRTAEGRKINRRVEIHRVD
jgi:outer membrane protein OmpA-like peptidoglycan-associated protein